ncbi:MAG: hypothetical protein U0V48_06800 [Anaerolineales bacterium]
MFGPRSCLCRTRDDVAEDANNGTGAHSILYGMSADHILEADVDFGDGMLKCGEHVNEKLSVNSDQLSVSSGQSSGGWGGVGDLREVCGGDKA